MNKYNHGRNLFSADKVRDAASDVQKEIMEEWFRKNFEDPSEGTPYMEGEFHYIYGGPYEADFELQQEFGDIVPDEVINALVEELTSECWEWAPVPGGNFYDQGFSDDPRQNFRESIDNINALLFAEIRNVRQEVHQLFYKLLYVNIITAVEAYLSDTFRQQITGSEDLLRRFVETAPRFRGQKIAMSEIYKAKDGMLRLAHGYLARFVWHRLDKTQKMYKDTLDVVSPKNAGVIARAIQIRHGIVHGEDIFVEVDSVDDLMSADAVRIDSGRRIFTANRAVLEDGSMGFLGKKLEIFQHHVKELGDEATAFVVAIDKQIKK